MKNNLNKGQETKQRILKAAMGLFYEKGYTDTTARQIAEASDANLGLIKYYFGGKGEIAQQVYGQIRQHMDDIIERELSKTLPDTGARRSKMFFLISSAIELYLCLENKHYGRFYNDIIFEPSIRINIQSIISEVLIKYTNHKGDENYVKMASLSISSIKPALVHNNMATDEKIPTKECLKYYLHQQLHFMGDDDTMADDILDIMDRYYIDVVDMFTPILTEIIR